MYIATITHPDGSVHREYWGGLFPSEEARARASYEAQGCTVVTGYGV